MWGGTKISRAKFSFFLLQNLVKGAQLEKCNSLHIWNCCTFVTNFCHFHPNPVQVPPSLAILLLLPGLSFALCRLDCRHFNATCNMFNMEFRIAYNAFVQCILEVKYTLCMIPNTNHCIQQSLLMTIIVSTNITIFNDTSS